MKMLQHTISRCYLENFIDESGFVWILDSKDKIFKTKPINILSENHFYTITQKSGAESFFIEDTLENIEGTYSTIFKNKILKDQFLTDRERAKFSIFIAALMLRTKPFRESLRRLFGGLKDNMVDWKKQTERIPKNTFEVPNDNETIKLKDVEEYLNNLDEEHSVGILVNLPEAAQLIFNMKWAVCKNTDVGFVSSDNPLVLLRPESIKKYGPNAMGSQPGLGYKDVELTLPLSNNRLLLAGWILAQDSYLPIENEIATNLNQRTIARASEQIISNSESKAIAIRAARQKITGVRSNPT